MIKSTNNFNTEQPEQVEGYVKLTRKDLIFYSRKVDGELVPAVKYRGTESRVRHLQTA